MARSLRLGDPGSVDLAPGSVILSRAVMRALEVSAGDVVEIRGRRRTVAAVAQPVGGGADDVAYADAGTRENAGVSVGDRAQVARATSQPAARVVLAPTQPLGFEESELPLVDRLAGRAVVEGDRVRLALLDGSVSIGFEVLETLPEGPVTITDETVIDVERTTAAAGRGALARSDVTFADVGGLEATITEVRRLVEVPLRHPELYDRFDGRSPNGVLLYGPSGTGKTLLATALSNELDVHFVPATAAETYEEFFSVSGDVRPLIDEAIQNAPSVVFFDELDALAPDREDAGGSDRRATSRVVSVLDAVAPYDDVIVLGATNRIDAVDPALRRGGRFDREIEVGVPDRDGRRSILETLTADLPVADGVDLDGIADRTHGFVGADLDSLVREAIRAAVARLPTETTFGADPIDAETVEGLSLTPADFDAGLDGADPSAMRDVRIERPETEYDDVGGLLEAKRELVRAVEWPLQYPELFATLRSVAPGGILLYGPPGTGKTLLAKAVARSTDANFIAVNGPELLNRYVGESEKAVREVFDTARQNAPSIVFFDELDALAPERGGNDSDAGVTERVVSQLLTELDGIEPREDVVVIAATNRPDRLDRALLRPGRLEKIVEVPIPDRDARREIFEIHTDGLPVTGVDTGELADRTDGYTGSDIEAVVREASLLAMEEYLTDNSFEVGSDLSDLRVRAEHVEAALDTVAPSVSDEMRAYYANVQEELPDRR